MTSLKLEVDAKDFAKAAQALERAGFDRRAGQTTSWAIRRIANLVRKNVRAELKPHNRTGKMRDRVRVKLTGSGLNMVGRVKTTGSGSNLVVGGVKPHPISPGKVMPIYGGAGKRLTLTGGNAIEGFATSVQHPGFKGDPFFHRGVKKSEDDIQTIVKASAQTMVKELAYQMRGK